MAEVDVDAIKEIRKKAETYAKKSGYAEYAEDFGSFAVIKAVRGKEINMNYLFIDFLRLTFGKTTSVYGVLSSREKKDYKEYIYKKDKRACQARDVLSDVLLDLKLEREDRIVFLLYFKWGFGVTEIADLFGFTETGMHMRLKKVLARSREVLK